MRKIKFYSIIVVVLIGIVAAAIIGIFDRDVVKEPYVSDSTSEDHEDAVMFEVETSAKFEIGHEETHYVLYHDAVFTITHYCPCAKCCGEWAGGPTASGVMPKANHTIAVDPDIIPLGSEVLINDHIYIAEDTGSAIKGYKIDIYCDDHQEALNLGIYKAEVRWRTP